MATIADLHEINDMKKFIGSRLMLIDIMKSREKKWSVSVDRKTNVAIYNEIMEIEKETKVFIKEYISMKKEIENNLDRMADIPCKEILERRYLKGFKWEDVARSMYISNRNVFRLHEKALQEYEKL